MSLYNLVANKKRPCYYCRANIFNHQQISGTFNLGWEYSVEQVEKNVPKHLISTFFKKFL